MKKLIAIYFVLSALCLLSCMGEDLTIIHQLKEKNLTSITKTFEVDLDLQTDGGININTDSGCQLNIDPKGFYAVGPELTGKINIEIIEIFDKGTMAITGKHTMSYDSILISGGEFFIRAYQGDKEIRTRVIFTVKIPVELTGDFSEDMQLFGAFSEKSNTLLDWRLLLGPTENIGVFGQNDTTTYAIGFSEFGWFNCDRFFDDPRERIELNISYPSKFKDKSVAVYLAIKNENNSLGIANQGMYPIGLDVHLIFTVEDDDQFLYQILSTKVSDEAYRFESNKMQLANSEELKNIINALE